MAVLMFRMLNIFKYSPEEVPKLFDKQTDSSVRLSFAQIAVFQIMTAPM